MSNPKVRTPQQWQQLAKTENNDYRPDDAGDKNSSGILSTIKRASQLRGLVFGNRIDLLLRGGLAPKSMTFLYGNHANQMVNILCGNAVRVFGGPVLFIDAANVYDPYLIIDKCAPKKSEVAAKKFISTITVLRAFTCYQLRKILSKEELEKNMRKGVNAIFVTGISSMFNEQDNTEAETERLQLLMASSLKKAVRGTQFVVASSSSRAEHFVSKCDTAIKLYGDNKAILMKHYARQFAVIDL